MSEQQVKDSNGGPPRKNTGGGVETLLRLDQGEPISGTLTSETQSTPFCGWMELIAAISVAHGELQQPGGCQRC